MLLCSGQTDSPSSLTVVMEISVSDQDGVLSKEHKSKLMNIYQVLFCEHNVFWILKYEMTRSHSNTVMYGLYANSVYTEFMKTGAVVMIKIQCALTKQTGVVCNQAHPVFHG